MATPNQTQSSSKTTTGETVADFLKRTGQDPNKIDLQKAAKDLGYKSGGGSTSQRESQGNSVPVLDATLGQNTQTSQNSAITRQQAEQSKAKDDLQKVIDYQRQQYEQNPQVYRRTQGVQVGVMDEGRSSNNFRGPEAEQRAQAAKNYNESIVRAANEKLNQDKSNVSQQISIDKEAVQKAQIDVSKNGYSGINVDILNPVNDLRREFLLSRLPNEAQRKVDNSISILNKSQILLPKEGPVRLANEIGKVIVDTGVSATKGFLKVSETLANPSLSDMSPEKRQQIGQNIVNDKDVQTLASLGLFALLPEAKIVKATVGSIFTAQGTDQILKASTKEEQATGVLNIGLGVLGVSTSFPKLKEVNILSSEPIFEYARKKTIAIDKAKSQIVEKESGSKQATLDEQFSVKQDKTRVTLLQDTDKRVGAAVIQDLSARGGGKVQASLSSGIINTKAFEGIGTSTQKTVVSGTQTVVSGEVRQASVAESQYAKKVLMVAAKGAPTDLLNNRDFSMTLFESQVNGPQLISPTVKATPIDPQIIRTVSSFDVRVSGSRGSILGEQSDVSTRGTKKIKAVAGISKFDIDAARSPDVTRRELAGTFSTVKPRILRDESGNPINDIISIENNGARLDIFNKRNPLKEQSEGRQQSRDIGGAMISEINIDKVLTRPIDKGVEVVKTGKGFGATIELPDTESVISTDLVPMFDRAKFEAQRTAKRQPVIKNKQTSDVSLQNPETIVGGIKEKSSVILESITKKETEQGSPILSGVVSQRDLIQIPDVKVRIMEQPARRTIITPQVYTRFSIPQSVGTSSISSQRSSKFQISTTRPMLEEDQRLSQSASLILMPVSRVRSNEDVVSMTRSRQRQVVSSALAQATIQEQKQETISPIFRGFEVTYPRVLDPEILRERPKVKLTESKKSKKKLPGFDVSVRRRGKFSRVNADPLTFDEAQREGAFITDNSAGRSFKITLASGDASEKKTAYTFRPERYNNKGTMFVQKTKFAISSKGEKREITEKGIATLRFRTKTNIFK